MICPHPLLGALGPPGTGWGFTGDHPRVGTGQCLDGVSRQKDARSPFVACGSNTGQEMTLQSRMEPSFQCCLQLSSLICIYGTLQEFHSLFLQCRLVCISGFFKLPSSVMVAEGALSLFVLRRSWGCFVSSLPVDADHGEPLYVQSF